MNKRILMILGALLLLIAITVGFIAYLQKRGDNLDNNNGQQTNNGSNNSSDNGGNDSNNNTPDSGSSTPDNAPAITNRVLTKITDAQTIAPALSFDGRSVWYFSSEGKLFKQSLGSGLKQEYVLPTKLEVSDALWPLVGNDFIVETSSGGSKTISYYDSEGKSYIPYPANIKHVDFMPDGRRVAYNWVETSGVSQLSIADYNTKNFRKIVDLPQTDQVIKVSPTGNRIFTYRKSSEEA
jgi:hypothetical protein